jgi:multiple sugar transport system substrate-binding protein
VSGGEWSLVKAAEPYRGVSVTASFLPRPGYEAAISLIPQFEQLTGINVQWESIYYEQMRNALILDFTSDAPKFDIILIDVVWQGEFASAGWIAPLDTFYNDPALADPNLDLNDFFPILLEAFGTWDKKIYGLPFDNYSGLLYYNKCMLEEAGFDRPPDTWQELKDIYGPALTKDNQYAFALQSPGETQSVILCALSSLRWSLRPKIFGPICPPRFWQPEISPGLMRYISHVDMNTRSSAWRRGGWQ